MLIYFNLLIRRYLNSLSMILAAYYFFSKAVKGFVFKVFWVKMMKVMLLCGAVLDVYIIMLFISKYYSNSNVKLFQKVIGTYG